MAEFSADKVRALMSRMGTQFIYAVLADMQPMSVKIGIAKHPEHRAFSLQSSCPVQLKLLGYVPGTKTLEKTIHGILRKQCVRGEWFSYEGEAKRIALAIATADLDALDACFN